jgi:hypothetical protein
VDPTIQDGLLAGPALAAVSGHPLRRNERRMPSFFRSGEWILLAAVVSLVLAATLIPQFRRSRTSDAPRL